MTVVFVALGGAIGAVARWFADTGLPRPGGFPLGITVVNVTGSLLLGLVIGIEVAEGARWLTPVTVGALGGFTTFSTWMVDIDRSSSIPRAVMVALVPLVIGLGAAAVGILAGVALA